MPDVPYKPVPVGEPVRLTPQIQVNVPGEAFGVNIGRALQQKGGALTEFGNDVFKWAKDFQSMNNEFEARQKVADFQEQAGIKQADFESLSPEAQKAGLQGHIAGLKALREGMMAQLGAPEAKLMYDRESQPFLGRTIFASAAFTGRNYKEYMYREGMANAARVGMNFSNGQDPEIESKLVEQEDAIRASQGYGDRGPEQTALAIAQAKTKTVRDALMFRIDSGDNLGVQDSLEKYSKYLTEEDRRVILDHSDAKAGSVDGRNAGLALAQAKTDPALAQQVIETNAKAYKSPTAQTNYIQSANAVYKHELLQDDYIRRTQAEEGRQYVYQKIANHDFNSVDDIHNDARAKAVYDEAKRLDKRAGNFYDNIFIDALRARDRVDHERVLSSLFHLADTKPQEFLKINPWDPKLELSNSDQQKLVARREKVLRGEAMEPGMRAAYQWLREEPYAGVLHSLDLDKKPAEFQPGTPYYNFWGAVQSGVHEWMNENEGRPPTREEFKDHIIRNIFNTTHHLWGYGTDTVDIEGRMMQPADADVVTHATNELTLEAKNRGLQAPTRMDIDSYILQQRWQKVLEDEKRGGSTEPASGAGPGSGPK
jgi:hypothetical protein